MSTDERTDEVEAIADFIHQLDLCLGGVAPICGPITVGEGPPKKLKAIERIKWLVGKYLDREDELLEWVQLRPDQCPDCGCRTISLVSGARFWNCDGCKHRWYAHSDDLHRQLRVANDALREGDNALAADVLAMCKQRDWSLHWTARGAYLHLESSELIEALRGKRGDPLSEAADVLLVLMSITENSGLKWSDVVAKARETCDKLKSKPRYAGEEFGTPDSPVQQPIAAEQKSATSAAE